MASKSNILVRIGGSITLQLFLLLLLPRLDSFNNGQEEVKNCFVKAIFSVLALSLALPLFWILTSNNRGAVVVLLFFPIYTLFSALKTMLFYLS